jgi:serine/threonine protein kinase
VAVKILEKDKIKDKKDVERITREIKILKKVWHPNVIQLYEVKKLSLILKIIETESDLFLIMEFCTNGELFDFIVANQRLNEK